jgi:hypothetical protein
MALRGNMITNSHTMEKQANPTTNGIGLKAHPALKVTVRVMKKITHTHGMAMTPHNHTMTILNGTTLTTKTLLKTRTAPPQEAQNSYPSQEEKVFFADEYTSENYQEDAYEEEAAKPPSPDHVYDAEYGW